MSSEGAGKGSGDGTLGSACTMFGRPPRACELAAAAFTSGSSSSTSGSSIAAYSSSIAIWRFFFSRLVRVPTASAAPASRSVGGAEGDLAERILSQFLALSVYVCVRRSRRDPIGQQPVSQLRQGGRARGPLAVLHGAEHDSCAGTRLRLV